MIKLRFLFFLAAVLLVGCKAKKDLNTITSKGAALKTELTPLELKNWYLKDNIADGIPGISLDKWYKQNKKKAKNTIVVAIIDTPIDTKHEDLKGKLWINSKEIPNNNIDDDQNGYIDDVNGWSFIGTKKGDYAVWNHYEYVRIVREWGPIFKGKTENEIASKELPNYKEYLRALKRLEEKEKYYKNWRRSVVHSIEVFPLVKDTLKHFFPKEDYTFAQLDSLYKKYKINDKTYKQRRNSNDLDLGALIDYRMVNLEVNEITLEDIVDKRMELDSILLRSLNADYNERLQIGDNPNMLEKGYGNNNIGSYKIGNLPVQDHCTKMAGLIGADRENTIGVSGILQNVKIMPLNVSQSGEENDKDIVMAIRYAVDNGAKVINMSLGKEFSLHKDWMFDALKYAEEHNVLVVHSAGNFSLDVDLNQEYPSDVAFDGTPEVCHNFINVGSTTHKLNEYFVSDFSDYGKENVDLFAPGEDVYTTTAGNGYEADSGTSISAAIVSGTAALIWSYYPNLTASEVKKIIIDSGTAYNVEVIVPETKDKKIAFSELSKSGKVLNVYNAMILAEKVSKNKK
jgi:subtilisin family serine protease